jgi:thiamine-monophosphate kinase
MGEVEIVRRIRDLASAGYQHRAVIKGIGDDCAVLRPSADFDLVFTTDFVLEGSHFTLATHKPQDVGHKALARSLSDLAAMGSEPVFCLVSLAIPPELSSRWIPGFYKGLLALAHRFKITLAGGDLSKSDKVIVDVMCCGRVPKGSAILRSGAKVGHRIYVSGRLGAAAHSGWRLRAEPRIEAGLRVRRFASAAMDLSDGLSLDLQRLCTESKVSAEIQGSALPMAPGATLNEALHGGEDYELLFTAPPTVKVPKRIGELPLTCIGVITRANSGQVLLDHRPLEPGGYDHFR